MYKRIRNLTKLGIALVAMTVLIAGPAMAQDLETAVMAAKNPYYDALPLPDGADLTALPSALKSAHDCTATTGNLVANCSFEFGFAAWTAVDMAIPLAPLGVFEIGEDVGWPNPFVESIEFGAFPVIALPTQGDYVAGHGFDGGGPDSIVLIQSVTLTGGDCELQFDYRAGWDMTIPFVTQPREFTVKLGDFSQTLLTAQPLWVADTLFSKLGIGFFPGSESASVTIPGCGTAAGPADLVFEWFIPEEFTGPAAFMLDNVQLVCDPTPSDCGGAVADVGTQIEDLDLDPALEDDLLDTIANALDKLDKGNIAAAIAQLRNLLGDIETALLGGDISAEDASALFAAVIDILAGLT